MMAITLTFDPATFVTEGVAGVTAVAVAVTVSAPANSVDADDNAIAVTVSVVADFNGVQVASGEATISDGGTSGTATLNITPPEQDSQLAERSIRVTAMATGYITEMADLRVRDARSVTITLPGNLDDPPTNPAVTEGGGAQSVAVTVTLSAAPGTGNTVAVTITPSAHGDPVTVSIAEY